MSVVDWVVVVVAAVVAATVLQHMKPCNCSNRKTIDIHMEKSSCIDKKMSCNHPCKR